jgi:hypothetical protein
VILIALALGTAAILPDLRANVVAFGGNEKVEMADVVSGERRTPVMEEGQGPKQ